MLWFAHMNAVERIWYKNLYLDKSDCQCGLCANLVKERIPFFLFNFFSYAGIINDEVENV
jgi:hypothetical protein